MNVHIIEDETPLLQALQIALSRAGHKTSTSSDGLHAAKEALAAKPDVVLVDILLPNKDGFMVMKELRSAGFAKPLIVLTNSNTADFDYKLLDELRVNTVLVKASISLSEVLAAVEGVKV